MFNRPNPARPMGVLRPEQASTEHAPTQKLTHLAPCQMYAVRFGDASGKETITIAFNIGGAWYLDKNGVKWASELQPMAGWLTKQVEEMVEMKQNPQVPTNDSVDLFEVPNGD